METHEEITKLLIPEENGELYDEFVDIFAKAKKDYGEPSVLDILTELNRDDVDPFSDLDEKKYPMAVNFLVHCSPKDFKEFIDVAKGKAKYVIEEKQYLVVFAIATGLKAPLVATRNLDTDEELSDPSGYDLSSIALEPRTTEDLKEIFSYSDSDSDYGTTIDTNSEMAKATLFTKAEFNKALDYFNELSSPDVHLDKEQFDFYEIGDFKRNLLSNDFFN